jgi:Ca2+-binding RTX toxin-like protein
MTLVGVANGINTLLGGSGANDITGGSGADTITGSTTAATVDTLTGAAGNDTFIIPTSATLMTASHAIDTISGGNDTDIISLTGTGYTIAGTDDWSRISSIEKLVLTSTATSASSIALDSTAETTGIMYIDASAVANDTTLNVSEYASLGVTLMGSLASGSTITGGGGNDIISGGGATLDNFTGGAGADTFRIVATSTQKTTINDFGLGADSISGAFTGAGKLVVTIDDTSTTALDLSTTLGGASGLVTITGGSGNDTITGGAHAPGAGTGDVITGGAGADKITGFGGADTITGGTGADSITISGGASADIVVAGGDSVASVSGSGMSGSISGHDNITGFTLAGVDKLDVAGTGTMGVVFAGGDGTDSTLLLNTGTAVMTHAVTAGLITFDDASTFATAVSLTTLGDVAAVTQCLETNDIGAAGDSVAFNATISGVAHTYVYTQSGASAGGDLVDLVGVTGTSLIVTGTTAGGILIA